MHNLDAMAQMATKGICRSLRSKEKMQRHANKVDDWRIVNCNKSTPNLTGPTLIITVAAKTCMTRLEKYLKYGFSQQLWLA